MERLGNQFLAGAGFPRDQHGGVRIHQFIQQAKYALHLVAFAHNIVQVIPPAQFPFHFGHSGQIPNHQNRADVFVGIIS